MLNWDYSMKHWINTGTVLALSFVLLYYSAAWAVLRCAHEEHDAREEACVHAGEVCVYPDNCSLGGFRMRWL